MARAARSRDPLWRALAALDPDPRRTALAVLAGTAALGCAIALMATSAWLISRAAQHPPVLDLSVAVVATRAFGIGRGVLRYVERLVCHDVALRGVVSVRERLYRRLAAADATVVAGLRRGDLLARVGADVDTLADLVVRSLLPFAVSALTGLVTAALLALVLPLAGLAVAAGLVVACVVAPWLAAVAARRAEQQAARERAEMSAEVLTVLDHLAELAVAGAVPAGLERLDGIDRRLERELDAAAHPAALAAGLATLATGVATLASLALGVQAVTQGRIPEVMLAVLVLTPMAAAEAALALPAAATGLVRSRAAAGRVMELLEAPVAVEASRPASTALGTDQAGADGADGAPAALTAPRLRARAVTCGWPGHPAVLREIDLDVTPGRRVAVVGGSGGGKTTLLLTLAGLLPPVAGQVLVGDAGGWWPVAELDPALVRRSVSFTAEDAYVFATTLRENLRVARPDASEQELLAALRRTGLLAWFAGLPHGLDTMLGPGGTDISGGERRRLLLARAVLVGAGVLLLDEPAEHLDASTADALLADLLGLGGAGPAVVVVTHRVSALGAADEVLVVADGAVMARGTHAELLAWSPSYAEAWRAEQGWTAAAAT